VVLGDEEDLQRAEMTVSRVNLIKYDHIPEGMSSTVKIRYKDKGTPGILHNEGDNSVRVDFLEEAKGVAPGQSAVFYEGDDVLGGGTIQRYISPF
jgi:tRNA-specific 2-thiouridylase